MHRVFNFGAGPATLPIDVLKEASENLINFNQNGLSIMEASHRSKVYEEIHNNAISLIKELYFVPNDYSVLLLQGGASLQFAMIPMNLSTGGKVQYVDTGSWSSKAIKEVQLQNINYEIVASSKDDSYKYIPSNIKFDENIDYAYITSNNTIYGTQYKEFPKTTCPLVVDASSDLFSYLVDWSNVDLLFAGAQKNAGIAGVTIVIIKNSLLDRVCNNIPTMLKYKTYAEHNSLYNTPPTFSIYMLELILKWIKQRGGIETIQKLNTKKASLIYSAIDNSKGFYIGHAEKNSRSLMNITFNIRNSELEDKLIDLAYQNNLIELKGHRSVGGLRASMYNAMPLDGVQKLKEIMEKFQQDHY